MQAVLHTLTAFYLRASAAPSSVRFLTVYFPADHGVKCSYLPSVHREASRAALGVIPRTPGEKSFNFPDNY